MNDVPGAETVAEDAIAPGDMPHDSFTFEQLAQHYNYRQTSDWIRMSARLFREECRRRDHPVRALDIGCGEGIGRKPAYTEAIGREVDELWGIEPDETVEPAAGVFHSVQHTLLEGAELPEDYFDVAYSFMVVEHVADPVSYMRAVSRCLRPGGVHIFVTVNSAHYFAKIAKLMKIMKLEETVLRMVRGSDKVDEYHYPVQYRMNHPRTIDRVAMGCGFEQPEHAFVEIDGPIGYFPGPLRPIYHALCYKRKVLRHPRSLLTLITRMRKSSG